MVVTSSGIFRNDVPRPSSVGESDRCADQVEGSARAKGEKNASRREDRAGSISSELTRLEDVMRSLCSSTARAACREDLLLF